MFSKAKLFAAVLIISASVIAAVLIGCDPVEKHKILSFFFDGVPPLLDPNAQVETAAQTEKIEPKQVKKTIFTHEPYWQCSKCHGERERRGFSRKVKLTASVPKLCYQCHDDYTKSGQFVHGPVAIGQCLFCHEHHHSKNQYLLKKPEPKLCFLCHQQKLIEVIPEHQNVPLAKCSRCHDAHASSSKALLILEFNNRKQL